MWRFRLWRRAEATAAKISTRLPSAAERDEHWRRTLPPEMYEEIRSTGAWFPPPHDARRARVSIEEFLTGYRRTKESIPLAALRHQLPGTFAGSFRTPWIRPPLSRATPIEVGK